MDFQLYMRLDKADGHPYSYMAFSEKYYKVINICEEHISLAHIPNYRTLAGYLPTSRTIKLDIDAVELICSVWANNQGYEMSIHFGQKKQVTIWRHKPNQDPALGDDFFEHDNNLVANILINRLYPIFEPLHNQVLAIE